jgi:hypothetical protein
MINQLTLPSGGAVSSLAVLRGDRPVAIQIGSIAVGVGVSFAPDSGSTFVALMRNDGSGLRYAVTSGGTAGAVVIEHPPTKWIRLEALTSTFGAATSAMVFDTL